MTISLRSLVPAALALPLVLGGRAGRAPPTRKAEFGVYEYVLRARRAAPSTTAAARAGVGPRAGGWRLLAKVDAGVPEGCRYRARVLRGRGCRSTRGS